MNAESKIREALKALMDDGEATACRIWTGYDMGTGETGVHFARFGQNATFIGKSQREALQWIEDEVEAREP